MSLLLPLMYSCVPVPMRVFAECLYTSITMTMSISIFFSSPPACADIKKQFSIPPQSARVELGGRTEIRCGAPSGLPLPTLQWLKNGMELVPDDAVLVTADGSLLIAHASMQVSEFQYKPAAAAAGVS